MSVFLSILLLAATTGALGDATVATLDGRTVAGRVTAWNAKELTIAGDNDVKLSAHELLDIRWPREKANAPAALSIELVDGTRIAYATFTLTDQKATITGGHFAKPMTVSRDVIKLIELQPTNAAIEAALGQIQQKNPAGDSLVVTKQNAQSMDYITGTMDDVTEDQVKFNWDGENVPIKRSRVAAIVVYQPKNRPLPEAVCEFTLTDGSRVAVRELQLKDDRLQVKTPAGIELDLPLSDLERANFSAGKIAYLSDLKPTDVRWTPRVALPAGAAAVSQYGQPRNDISYSGSPLSLLWKDDVARSRRDVRTYNKGLAIRSRTEMTYRIPAGMKRFIATAGIDPLSASQGNVTLTVRGDDRVLWQGPIDGKGSPVEIDVELQSAHRLQLVVDYGENLDYGDRLHLAEARLTK
jgi:hypothetical protein